MFRVRTDEKAIFNSFAARGIVYQQIDGRSLGGNTGTTLCTGAVVLNREISYSRASYGASLLESQGFQVINSAASIKLCGDKWETTRALQQAGLPMPATLLALTPEAALEAGDAMGWPLIIKPLVGSWGRRIGCLRDREGAALVLDHVAALPSPQSHVIYLQELIDDIEADLRLLVIGDQLIGTCRRLGVGIRKNVALGSETQPWSPDAETVKMGIAAAQAVGAELAGVDILISRSRGPLLLEVNAGVEFSGLQGALGPSVDVADAIVTHVMDRLSSGAAA